MRRIGAICLSTILGCTFCAAARAADRPDDAAGPGIIAQAWESVTDSDAWAGAGHWRAAAAPWAQHFHPSPEHKHVWAVAVERQRPDDWMAGLSYFRNSFGQPCAYAYVGRRFTDLVDDRPELFFQASAGILYGYKNAYKDKVPANVDGFSPGALIGLGWQFNQNVSATVHLLGDAALMLQLAWDFR